MLYTREQDDAFTWMELVMSLFEVVNIASVSLENTLELIAALAFCVIILTMLINNHMFRRVSEHVQSKIRKIN